MRSLGETRAKLNRDLSELGNNNRRKRQLLPKRKVINEVREAEGKQTEQELTNAIKN
jgi:hypothetical protein